MKRFFIFALIASVFVACSTDATQDLAPEIPTAPDELHVSFDAEDIRIQLGENGSPVWTKGDLVSVFYKSNANQQWQFQGKTGDSEGTLKRVNAGTATVAMEKVVAVYPYNENYLITPSSGNIEASLPAEQTYLADSYGVGSSMMIASGDYKQFALKNVCGWLKLQFTGSGYVSKIILRGNNGEQVAGNIYICADDASCVLASEMGSTEDDGIGGTGGNLVFDDAILTEVTLNCGEAGVRLNAETPTAFYIALPPQIFTKGITITATCDDEIELTKSTESTLTIERNHIVPMTTLSIEKPQEPDTPAQPTPPADEIWYTSTDGKIVEPYFDDEFGATLLSNTYKEGKGVMKFNGNVTKVGEYAFKECKALTSLTIPDSVTTIGKYAFYLCRALESINIPNSITSIGYNAFYNCEALTRVDITDLEAWCKISFINGYANPLCHAGNLYLNGVLLENVVVPESITELKDYVFCGAKCIKSVTIHNKVTSIGSYAFYSGSALTSVTIPNSVTSIGEKAFYNCSKLKEVYCKPTTPPTGGSYMFDSNASGRRIYVPAASVDAYKAASYWSDYASDIEPYNFTE